MSSHKPTIYLIAGCNGAGKTTFAREFLPQEAKCLNFLNADLIALGLSPFDSRAGALKAGRLLLKEFQQFVSRHQTFALESTLSGKTYAAMLSQAKENGFQIYLHYLWLPSLSIALARVRERVKKGGHNYPPQIFNVASIEA
jgi:predicted ABC-type ATPase